MRHLFVTLALAACAVFSGFAHAQTPQNVVIERYTYGSGEPDKVGLENATQITNDVFHAPQYMPGSPTAASIWSRVIEVPCTRSPTGVLQCKGYHWSPAMGRAEYLYFRPVLVAQAQAPAAAAPPPAVLSDAAPAPMLPRSEFRPARADRN